MTHEERVQAVVDCGFTERQARFLVLVLRHGGVCVPRQYASFAGLARGGRRSNAFFAKLVRRLCAAEIGCVHNRARLYHLHSRGLYCAIGESESRYRRPLPARAAVERLMVLDAVLSSPNLTWLATESEKADFLADIRTAGPAASSQQSPTEREPGGATELPDGYPIGLEPSGRAVLLYLATVPWPDAFRQFLREHAALLLTLPAWTLRLVFPRPVDRAYGEYQAVVREELETPLQPATIGEVKRYFEFRRETSTLRPDTVARMVLQRDLHLFSGGRFTTLYRRWLKHGDVVMDALLSPAISEALGAATARVESVVLPHSYRHLLPLVDDADAASLQVQKGFRRGKREGKSPGRPLNPRPEPPSAEPELTIPEQLKRDWDRANECYKARVRVGLPP